MDGAVLVALPPDTTSDEVRSAPGTGAAHGIVCRWASAEPTLYGFLVLGADVEEVCAPHLAYRPRGHPMRLTGQPDVGSGTVFAVANNVLDGRDAEFDSWYETVHIPHTFECFGFTAARRFTATDRSSAFQHVVAYASPDDRQTVEEAIGWAATERELAVREGREPSLPVSETVVAPRHAGFYTLCR